MLKTLLITALLLLSAQESIGQFTVPQHTGARGASGPPFSDSFAYTGNLSANWSGDTTSFTAASGSLAPTVSSATTPAWWSAGTFANNQFSCTTISANPSTSSSSILPAIRMTSVSAGYIMYINSGTTWQLYNANLTLITTGTGSVTVGHEYCLYAVGTSLTFEDKTTSTTILTATDSSYSSGSAGINVYGDNTTNTISHWRGGNGTP
jgi:hypothetical protein